MIVLFALAMSIAAAVIGLMVILAAAEIIRILKKIKKSNDLRPPFWVLCIFLFLALSVLVLVLFPVFF